MSLGREPPRGFLRPALLQVHRRHMSRERPWLRSVQPSLRGRAVRTWMLPWVLLLASFQAPPPPTSGAPAPASPFPSTGTCWHHASPAIPTLCMLARHSARQPTPTGAGLGLSNPCFSQQRQDETVVPVRTLRFGCSPVNPKPFPQEMKSLRPTSPRTLTSLRCSFPGLEMGQKKVSVSGTSLAVQWLRLCTSTAGVTGSTPGPGKKILHAVRCSQKINFLKKGVHFRGCWEGRAKKGCKWHLVTGQMSTRFHFL